MIKRFFNKHKVWSILALLVCAYGLYVFIFGVLIFAGPRRVSEDYKAQSSIESYYGTVEQWSVDRAALIELPNEAAFVRLQMISLPFVNPMVSNLLPWIRLKRLNLSINDSKLDLWPAFI